MKGSFWGQTREYRKEIIALWAWPILAYFLTLYTDSGMLGVTILFFLPPAFYLFHKIGNKKHIGILTIVMSLAIFPVDYIAHASGLWNVNTLFPRVFEVAVLEDLLWEMLVVPYIIGFHERYFDDNDFKYFNKKFELFEGVALLSLIVIVTGASLPSTLNFPLAYALVLGPIALVPLIYGVKEKITSLGYVTVYFGFVHLLHELAAIQVDAWHFPLTNTSAIATISIFGHTLPLEEFLIYVIMMSPALVCYHHILSKETTS